MQSGARRMDDAARSRRVSCVRCRQAMRRNVQLRLRVVDACCGRGGSSSGRDLTTQTQWIDVDGCDSEIVRVDGQPESPFGRDSTRFLPARSRQSLQPSRPRRVRRSPPYLHTGIVARRALREDSGLERAAMDAHVALRDERDDAEEVYRIALAGVEEGGRAPRRLWQPARDDSTARSIP